MRLNWYSVPLRKPLAVYAAALVGLAVVGCILSGRDLPQNVADLLRWFGGVTIAAYFTSSSAEAIKGGRGQ